MCKYYCICAAKESSWGGRRGDTGGAGGVGGGGDSNVKYVKHEIDVMRRLAVHVYMYKAILMTYYMYRDVCI